MIAPGYPIAKIPYNNKAMHITIAAAAIHWYVEDDTSSTHLMSGRSGQRFGARRNRKRFD